MAFGGKYAFVRGSFRSNHGEKRGNSVDLQLHPQQIMGSQLKIAKTYIHLSYIDVLTVCLFGLIEIKR